MKDIGLIENNKILRQSFTRYFKKTGIFNVIFSVSNIKDSLEYSETFPALILLDVNRDAITGINTIPLIKRIFPEAKIVVIGVENGERINKKALKKGAVGYLQKSNNLAYIVNSLIRIDQGESPLSVENNLEASSQSNNSSNENKSYELTIRELELIEILSEGVANKVAADMLGVTYFTVNQHLKNIYKKLNINSKAQLISWYLNSDDGINKYSWK